MNQILLLNNKNQKCGVHQYGVRLAGTLKKSKKYEYLYHTVGSCADVDALIESIRPLAVIYNYHPVASPWMSASHLDKWRGKTSLVGVAHDGIPGGFDYCVFGDPTFKSDGKTFSTPRIVSVPVEQHRTPRAIPIIGTFGLAFDRKGFDDVILRASRDFEKAIVRVHAPIAAHSDDTSSGVVKKLREIKPDNIDLEISQDFLSDDALLSFLDGNDINVFLYHEWTGISSVIDYALSVDRPIAVNETSMFHHLAPLFDDISVLRNDLGTIMDRGTSPLKGVKNEWREDNTVRRYDEIFDTIRDNRANRVLSDNDRWYYQRTINNMFSLCPDMMKRKPARANVQQAFVVETVVENGRGLPVLAVGAYEDTAAESLTALGYNVTGIDPALNCDLHTYRNNNPDKKYATIVSTSVIEHVIDDEQFIDDICSMLQPGGVAVLTMDFNNTPGAPKPLIDARLYTEHDLTVRLKGILDRHNCSLIGKPRWSGDPDFEWEGCRYSFATFVYRKN
jgi:hypothetical protein